LDPERGVFSVESGSALLSMQLVSISGQVIVLAGREAFFSTGNHLCCPLERISTIITDQPMETGIRHKLPLPGITMINP